MWGAGSRKRIAKSARSCWSWPSCAGVPVDDRISNPIRSTMPCDLASNVGGMSMSPFGSGDLDELRRQFWSDAFVFVFEKDEGVLPFLGLHSLHPFNQIIFVVSCAPQPQVSPVRGADDFSQRLFIRVGNHQRAVLRAQQSEDFIVKPRFVTEFKSTACIRP